MKPTGIVRKVDELGRVVLPMELRRTMDIEIGTPMEIYTDGENIVIKKYQPGCFFCGDMDIAMHFADKPLCGECVRKIRAALKEANAPTCDELEGWK